MTTPAFSCYGLSHRPNRHVGLLRASVRALSQDVRTLLEDTDNADLRRLFHRDLRRAHQVLSETDGRMVFKED
jgi:hypothetical protein